QRRACTAAATARERACRGPVVVRPSRKNPGNRGCGERSDPADRATRTETDCGSQAEASSVYLWKQGILTLCRYLRSWWKGRQPAPFSGKPHHRRPGRPGPSRQGDDGEEGRPEGASLTLI